MAALQEKGELKILKLHDSAALGENDGLRKIGLWKAPQEPKPKFCVASPFSLLLLHVGKIPTTLTEHSRKEARPRRPDEAARTASLIAPWRRNTQQSTP